MLINRKGILINYKDGTIIYKGKNAIHYVEGFFWVQGFKSGEESIREIDKVIENENRIPFEIMRGAFLYFIEGQNYTMFFTCNSMMAAVYASKWGYASKFLDLLEWISNNGGNVSLNPQSISEWYSLGNIYFGKTFFNEISMLKNTDYIKWQNGEESIFDKGIGDIDNLGKIDNPKAFYSDLVKALDGHNVALSITGGYDSRLILSQLYNKMPIKLFVSGNVMTKDLTAAVNVTEAVGMKLDIVHANKPEKLEEFLNKIVYDGDGMIPISIEGDYRLYTARKKLQADGVDLQLTGDGGVLHKDWEWLQDLPFYHKKKTDLKRFYYHRIAYSRSAPFCGELIKGEYENQEKYFIANMQKYVREINTKSYDMLYHYASCNMRCKYNCNIRTKFVEYAPLIEFDMVRYSYHLPRGKRFFYNYMRRMMTEANVKMARIPTEYGTTASSEVPYLFRDVFFQIKEYFVKLDRLLRRKLRIKSKDKSVIDWDCKEELLKLPLLKDAMEFSVKKGILSDDASMERIPYEQAQRLVHLYILCRKYAKID